MAQTANDVAWREGTLAFQLHDGTEVTCAQAEAIFADACDAEHWKNPTAVFVHHSNAELVRRVLQYFHGGTPRIEGFRYGDGKVLVVSDGYAC